VCGPILSFFLVRLGLFDIFANNAGALKWLLVLLSCMVWFVVDYGACGRALQLEAPSLSPAAAPVVAVDDLPLPTNAHGLKHLPAPIPSRANFTKGRGELQPPVSGFKNIAPMHPIADAIPSALAQPPLSPYVSGKKRKKITFLMKETPF